MSDSNVIEVDFNHQREPNQVFTEIRTFPKYKECQHFKLSLDEATDSVGCSDCGQRLNPMWVLKRLAERHNRFYWNYAEVYRKTEKAKAMNRCKCQHCGRMTLIVKT